MDWYPATYGDRIAEVYDTLYEAVDISPMIDFLASRAGPGPALELGIGTGRVALPLLRRGVEVHGIDASAAMVEQLRAKEHGDEIRVVLGDFADCAVQDKYPLIYAVFNTFFALLTQEAQVRCFTAVAEHLADGGAFVIETFVPDLTLFDRGQRISPTDIASDRVLIDVTQHDSVRQVVTTQHLVLSGGAGIRMYPVMLRYAWPSELDLMAQIAGLRLIDRWGGWKYEPFDAGSQRHVSVYSR
jgi:SAM-dependent methyltransferase